MNVEKKYESFEIENVWYVKKSSLSLLSMDTFLCTTLSKTCSNKSHCIKETLHKSLNTVRTRTDDKRLVCGFIHLQQCVNLSKLIWKTAALPGEKLNAPAQRTEKRCKNKSQRRWGQDLLKKPSIQEEKHKKTSSPLAEKPQEICRKGLLLKKRLAHGRVSCFRLLVGVCQRSAVSAVCRRFF